MGALFGLLIGIPVGMTIMIIARICGWGEGGTANRGPG